MAEKLLNAEELAKYLDLNQVTVYKLAKAGKLPAIRVGKQWRFKKELIDSMTNNYTPSQKEKQLK